MLRYDRTMSESTRLIVVLAIATVSLCGCGQSEKSDIPSGGQRPRIVKSTRPVPATNRQRDAGTDKNSLRAANSNQETTSEWTPGTGVPTATSSGPVFDASVQYLDVRLQDALRSYQAAEDKSDRSILASRMTELIDAGVPKQQVAVAFGKMLREETSVEVKTDILSELGDLEDPAAFNEIVWALDKGQPQEIRKAAIEALDTLGDQRAAPMLQQLLSDRDAEIREAAQDALDSLSNP